MPHYTPDHLYLTPEELRDLSRLLSEIPSLTADLEDAFTGRARLGDPNYRLKSRSGDQPLPYSTVAAQVRDHLHAIIVSWVRLICEQRALTYSGPTSTPDLARWLNRNLIALAMTEGAESAPDEIRAAVEAAERVVCPPSNKPVINDAAIEAARVARLNANGIATLAKQLGVPFRNLTARRVRTLKESGKIAPVPGPWAPDWPELFEVGPVLDAHLRYPARRRTSSSAPQGAHRHVRAEARLAG
ncbi:hypothetical protein [Nocardia huaxiensis]|uniref:Uncharacterized protein n=1 Tax=Nocardia huaxiensis TaxID=2755382 RepID=A0A7D6VCA1_9NOCA|nr:hypothetical protein [Nocardia huaxiensis]QLY30842.1 hypothetical protein H0264_38170 [Nocardia huaxiensis]UFS94346.1 hypothetical protein LPY97_26755 [Nocardia huaxiensis]